MPKISGREVISEKTEKIQSRILLVGSIAIISKSYGIPFSDLKISGMDMPAAIVDVGFLVSIVWLTYSYLVNWVGDLLSFRLWYSESSVWTNFGTNLKLDKYFIGEGVEAMKTFVELRRSEMTPIQFSSLSQDDKNKFDNFVTNVELYGSRLEHAGRRFTTISAFGHFYVWVQGFIIPVGIAIIAGYFLVKFGSFVPPSKL